MIILGIVAVLAAAAFWASCVLGAEEDKHSGMK